MKSFILPCLIFVFLTGCSQNGHQAQLGAVASVEPVASAPSSGGAIAPSGPVPKVGARMIIRTAEMHIVAKDPAATLQALSALAEARGGYIADSKQWREEGQAHATLTLRVPANQLGPTLAAIRTSALRTDSENVTGEDVSQEYSDLSAQLTNLEATERELRQLLTTVRQRTQRASDVLEVFNQLTKVRGDIDQTKGRLLQMGQQVDLATISLEIAPDALAKPVTETGWQPTGVVRDAFRALVTTLKWVAEVLIWFCIYVVPVGVLAALLVFFIRRVFRRVRNGLGRPDQGDRPR